MTVQTPQHHLFSLRVENKSGVLVRVAGLFARRGFNIVSLAVAPTSDERFSKISIVVDAESAPLQQVRDQLDKLINVVEIAEISPGEAPVVELALFSVRAGDSGVTAVLATHGAPVLEETSEAVLAMCTAAPSEIDALEAALRRFGIIDLQRTGWIAIPTTA